MIGPSLVRRSLETSSAGVTQRGCDLRSSPAAHSSISNSRSDWPKSSQRPDVGSLVERGGDERPPRDPFIGPKKFLDLGTQNPCLCGSDKPLDFEQSFRLAEFFAAPRRGVLGGAWRRRAPATRPLHRTQEISGFGHTRIPTFLGRIRGVMLTCG